VPWDPYSEEDFDDFFIWLMIHRFDKCIYDNWTDKK
jgi:hypothetical protein